MALNPADHSAFSDSIEAGDVSTVASMIQQHPELVNHPQWTPPPLHCAVLWNQVQIVQLLLDNGADLEMRDPDQQTTPLRYAIMYCKVEVIPVLLQRGASSAPIVEGGSSALELAKQAAAGAFEEFEDLPAKEAYAPVVALLERLAPDE